MIADDDSLPKIGSEACMLGVRLPPNATPDVHPDTQGYVTPLSEGMSVSPSLNSLPEHRLPRRLQARGFRKARGNNRAFCFRMGSGPFVRSEIAHGLILLPDEPDELGNVRHGIIAPTTSRHVDDLQADLAATRDRWVIDEE